MDIVQRAFKSDSINTIQGNWVTVWDPNSNAAEFHTVMLGAKLGEIWRSNTVEGNWYTAEGLHRTIMNEQSRIGKQFKVPLNIVHCSPPDAFDTSMLPTKPDVMVPLVWDTLPDGSMVSCLEAVLLSKDVFVANGKHFIQLYLGLKHDNETRIITSLIGNATSTWTVGETFAFVNVKMNF